MGEDIVCGRAIAEMCPFIFVNNSVKLLVGDYSKQSCDIRLKRQH